MVVGAADFMGAFLFICHMEEKLPRLLGWNHKTEKIDGAVAMLMGLDRAIRNGGSTGSVYDERGF